MGPSSPCHRWPQNVTRPRARRSTPASTRRIVLLPAPEGPTIAIARLSVSSFTRIVLDANGISKSSPSR